jgi:hypothetical protein
MTILLQREPPARDSTFLLKLYFEKARQLTLNDTLFRYETINKTLLDSDFIEEGNPALYQIRINQQQSYKDKVEQENRPDNFPLMLERLDFRFETLKNTFLNNNELQYPDMELYPLLKEDILYPGWKMTDYIEKRRK